jgi:hypothetical protein
MRSWIIAHRIVGFGGLAAFLASGWYMQTHEPAMNQLPDGMRMMFRSRHIYLLLASLINIVMGAYWQPAGRRWLQHAGSAAVLAAPVLFAAGFLREPYLPGLDRSFTVYAVVAALAGTLANAFAGRRRETAPQRRAAAASR